MLNRHLQNCLFLTALLFVTSCMTLQETTKASAEVSAKAIQTVVVTPVKTVVTVGKNGGKVISNYYDHLEEINTDQDDDEIILLKREF